MKAGAPPFSGQCLIVETVHDSGSWSWLGNREDANSSMALALVGAVPLPSGTCSATVVLATDAIVRDLNREWRKQDKPTNVLSFPSPRPALLLAPAGPSELFIGDVVLAEETVLREAAEQAKAAPDHYRHLVLHGLLHLLGFDHETPEDADRMEAIETELLAGLGAADPYAGTDPSTGHRVGGAGPG
jgi:probable rRNA maturation factor